MLPNNGKDATLKINTIKTFENKNQVENYALKLLFTSLSSIYYFKFIVENTFCSSRIQPMATVNYRNISLNNNEHNIFVIDIYYSVSLRTMGDQWTATLKPLVHHSTMVWSGLRAPSIRLGPQVCRTAKVIFSVRKFLWRKIRYSKFSFHHKMRFLPRISKYNLSLSSKKNQFTLYSNCVFEQQQTGSFLHQIPPLNHNKFILFNINQPGDSQFSA